MQFLLLIFVPVAFIGCAVYMIYQAYILPVRLDNLEEVHRTDVEYKYGINSPILYCYDFDQDGFDFRCAEEIQESISEQRIYLSRCPNPVSEEGVAELSKKVVPEMALAEVSRDKNSTSRTYTETDEGRKILSAKAYIRFVRDYAPAIPQQHSLYNMEKKARKGSRARQQRRLAKLYGRLDERQKLLADKL